MKTDLSKYDNSFYKPGNPVRRIAWYCINVAFLRSSFPVSGIKKFWLRLFGAKIGCGVVIKPCVNIKYPWFLTVGDHVWIGENVWIDNLDQVTIGSNSCISQGALLLCGNHDYRKPAFDLIVKPITLEEGVWIGAKAIVSGGRNCGSHAVLTAGSVCNSDLEPFGIYQGNPAVRVKTRLIV